MSEKASNPKADTGKPAGSGAARSPEPGAWRPWQMRELGGPGQRSINGRRTGPERTGAADPGPKAKADGPGGARRTGPGAGTPTRDHGAWDRATEASPQAARGGTAGPHSAAGGVAGQPGAAGKAGARTGVAARAGGGASGASRDGKGDSSAPSADGGRVAGAGASAGRAGAKPGAAASQTSDESPPQDESSRRRAEAAHQKALNAEREQARKEGHKEGVEAGKQAGYEQGLKEGREEAQAELQARVEAVLQPLRKLALQFSEALSRLDDEMANELVELALATGRHLAAEALETNPEQVLDLVRALLHSEPVLHGRPRLWLNPVDYELVNEAMGQELDAAGWALQPDSQLERGGCRLTSDHGELDASAETRWTTVCQQVRRRRSTSEKTAEAEELLAAAGFEASAEELESLSAEVGEAESARPDRPQPERSESGTEASAGGSSESDASDTAGEAGNSPKAAGGGGAQSRRRRQKTEPLSAPDSGDGAPGDDAAGSKGRRPAARAGAKAGTKTGNQPDTNAPATKASAGAAAAKPARKRPTRAATKTSEAAATAGAGGKG